MHQKTPPSTWVAITLRLDVERLGVRSSTRGRDAEERMRRRKGEAWAE